MVMNSTTCFRSFSSLFHHHHHRHRRRRRRHHPAVCVRPTVLEATIYAFSVGQTTKISKQL